MSTREWESDVVVARREQAADGVVALTLLPANGHGLPDWTPGAHVDLVLAPGLVRQYSLCGSAHDGDSWRVGVLLDEDGRGGSRHVHEHLQEGATVRVRGPRNHFALAEAPRYQFIAGGIGITPILAMIEEAEARGADWRLLYGGRQRDSMAFVDELAAYGDRVTLWPQDSHGMLDLASVLGTPADDTLVYCCGPEGLLGAVEAACADWPAGSLHVERFAAKAGAGEGAADSLDSFEVVCRRSGITVDIGPGDTILEALEQAGVDVIASCAEGICGTCECSVLDGTPDHRDSMLTDAEREAGEVMMICVSRSRSQTLVLDV